MGVFKAMQRLEGKARKAMQTYKMIQPKDRVCVAVSGGKDSVALALVLGHLRRYYDCAFEVHALTIDPCFSQKESDYSALEALFVKEEIPFTVLRSNIGSVVFEQRKEKNPCALCAKLRRGMLHTQAKKLGCNKIALGHHLDDAVETFYMNLFLQGHIACFSPVTWLSRKELTMIRPLVLATEAEVQNAVREEAMCVLKSGCPAEGKTKREEMKTKVQKWAEEDPAFRQKMLGALQGSAINGWGIGEEV